MQMGNDSAERSVTQRGFKGVHAMMPEYTAQAEPVARTWKQGCIQGAWKAILLSFTRGPPCAMSCLGWNVNIVWLRHHKAMADRPAENLSLGSV